MQIGAFGRPLERIESLPHAGVVQFFAGGGEALLKAIALFGRQILHELGQLIRFGFQNGDQLAAAGAAMGLAGDFFAGCGSALSTAAWTKASVKPRSTGSITRRVVLPAGTGMVVLMPRPLMVNSMEALTMGMSSPVGSGGAR